MEKTNNRPAGGSKLLRGLVIGSAVGATVALLTTPKTGKDMRETIRRKSDEISTAAKDRVASFTAQARKRREISVIKWYHLPVKPRMPQATLAAK